ncbi:GDSL-type esterase/lipase family protein [Levilactobacillus fujinensis]|uniref:GDSL-type esterase/lipase family protein n=1 Tax=Levilactobacillus fujinensis TaxID=2486024 RepID=A0ABW1THL3_9LACO|nr:GDSL-type esterase/lipase family protein [Levilactobacillus fujinensis]
MRVQAVTANNALMPVYFQGRWVEKTICGQRVMYSTNLGAEFWFRVDQASVVTLNMLNLAQDVSAWIAVQIDGLPYQRMAVKTLPWRLNLDGHQHVIRVVMSGNTDADPLWATDAGFAVQSVRSDGELQAVRPGQHSITFIGDSITAGCWVIPGRHAAVDYRAEANYAAIASDLLGLRDVRVAYSAAGVSWPGTGGVPPLPQVLTAIDDRTSWQPEQTDLVVVNVGTNDRRITVAAFEPLFEQFLRQIQNLYPLSRVAVMVPFNQRFAAAVSTIAIQAGANLITTADWQPSTTDGVHVDTAGSQLAGHKLAEKLRELYPDLLISNN